MNSRQKVANRIMKLCDDRWLTLNALANASAVPPSTLKSIINGDSKNPGTPKWIQAPLGPGPINFAFFHRRGAAGRLS